MAHGNLLFKNFVFLDIFMITLNSYVSMNIIMIILNNYVLLNIIVIILSNYVYTYGCYHDKIKSHSSRKKMKILKKV